VAKSTATCLVLSEPSGCEATQFTVAATNQKTHRAANIKVDNESSACDIAYTANKRVDSLQPQ